jgi:hypothetical protein
MRKKSHKVVAHCSGARGFASGRQEIAGTLPLGHLHDLGCLVGSVLLNSTDDRTLASNFIHRYVQASLLLFKGECRHPGDDL